MWPMFYSAIALLFGGAMVSAVAIKQSPPPELRQILGPMWRTVLFLLLAALVLAGIGTGIGISQIATVTADSVAMLVFGLFVGGMLIVSIILTIGLSGFGIHLRRRRAPRRRAPRHHHDHDSASESDQSS